MIAPRMQLFEVPDDGSSKTAFPYQDEIMTGESGHGYALRMAAGNGLEGLLPVKQLLGKSHSAALNSEDSTYLAYCFGASLPLLEFALERITNGRRDQACNYGGQVLGRSYFLSRTYPRICPDCLAELGYCRISWDFSISVACARHRRVLIGRCAACQRQLSWNRPALAVCVCGFPLAGDRAEEPTEYELLIAHQLDLRMSDTSPSMSIHSRQDAAGGFNTRWFETLFRNLSVDGMTRIIYGLSTAAKYTPEKLLDRKRGALDKARQTISSAMTFGEQLANGKSAVLSGQRPSVLVELLADISTSSTATKDDLSLASSLLTSLLRQPSRSTLRSNHPSLAQMVLF